MSGSEADFKVISDLALRCSGTLESLDIINCLDGVFPLTSTPDQYLTSVPDLSTATSFNLSTATKLKDMVFRCTESDVQWITMALKTVIPKNLRQITILPVPDLLQNAIGETVRREWEELDTCRSNSRLRMGFAQSLCIGWGWRKRT